MKKKSKHAMFERRKEFRFHKVLITNKRKKTISIKHPSYVFLKKGNVYIFVTITHSNKVDGKVLVELRHNPDPNDKRKAYWVTEVKKDTKDTFGRREDKWKMDPEDDKDIREKYEK